MSSVNLDNRTNISQPAYSIFGGEKELLTHFKTSIKSTMMDTAVSAALFFIAKPYIAQDDMESFTSNACMVPFGNLVFRQFNYLIFGKSENIISRIMHQIPAASFSLLHKIVVGSLSHELGHYYAIKYYDDSQFPRITLRSIGGAGIYYQETPAVLKNRVNIVAAGPAAAIGLATIQIVMSHFLKSRPTVSAYLNAAAIMNIYTQVTYALSAFEYYKSDSHDFVNLWKKADIHPYTAALAMVGVPLLAKSTLMLGDYCWKALTKKS